MYDFVIKFDKVFRAHCTQIWGTSRLAFDWYTLVLHYQVYGEERFPKLFFDEKLFVRFAKVSKCKSDCMSKKKKKKKKKIENIVSIQSYMYDFVTIFKKVCLGLIAPKFEVPQSWLRPVHVIFTLSSVLWRKITKISFLRKVIRPFRKISKCETGSLHEKRKC